jgi:hypothetical protein
VNAALRRPSLRGRRCCGCCRQAGIGLLRFFFLRGLEASLFPLLFCAFYFSSPVWFRLVLPCARYGCVREVDRGGVQISQVGSCVRDLEGGPPWSCTIDLVL